MHQVRPTKPRPQETKLAGTHTLLRKASNEAMMGSTLLAATVVKPTDAEVRAKAISVMARERERERARLRLLNPS
jgi:hypothetical protein